MSKTKARNSGREVENWSGPQAEAWGACVEGLPIMAWQADPEGRPQAFNKALRQDADLTPDWPCAAAHPDERETLAASWAHAIHRGETFELDFRRTGRDGIHRWRRIRAEPQRDEAGRLRGWHGVVIDTDEQRACERQLAEAEQQRHQFLAILGHELRNPLATIVSALQVLETLGAAQGEVLEMREIIRRQSQLMKRLVDDLLDISRIARNKISLRVGRVDLGQLVREATYDARRAAEDRGVELRVSIPESTLECQGDAPRLRQALDNVLGNALKFTDHGGRIDVTLSADADGDWAELRIKDTGIGITPDMLEQLFTPFVQAESSLARSQGGLGLGLALGRGLIELHGGTITVASEGLQMGSLFTIRLPLSQPAHAEPMAAATSLRVLVIEDRRDAAVPLVRLLRGAGHAVELAVDGLSGLELALQFKPQVIICDIGLPGIDGYEVARRVRRQELLRGAYLVALTGYGLDSDRQQALEAGFDHYLRKPIDFAELRSVVELARRAQSS